MSSHLIVSDQQQPHQRCVEHGLGDVGCFSLEAFLRHEGSTEGLARAFHTDATGTRHPIVPENLWRSDQKGFLRKCKPLRFAPVTKWGKSSSLFVMHTWQVRGMEKWKLSPKESVQLFRYFSSHALEPRNDTSAEKTSAFLIKLLFGQILLVYLKLWHCTSQFLTFWNGPVCFT